ncbi:MAG: hypothetical protein CM1200mP26_29110 [Acidimicrobiales bacterium]|nr:MAG: hypothetical protein CM1200mP26_29110 [Acidimicrobiales bacterium]
MRQLTFFRCWDPAMVLFAETSGKNALVVTPRLTWIWQRLILSRRRLATRARSARRPVWGFLVGPVATDEGFFCARW